MFQKHLSPWRVCMVLSWPDRLYERGLLWQTGGKLLVFPDWGMLDWQKGKMTGKPSRMRKKGQEMLRWAPPKYWYPWILNSCLLSSNYSSSTACVCVFTGYIQPWRWAYPACLGTCAFVSLSWVCTWCRCWSLTVVWDVDGCSSVPQYCLLEYSSKAPQDLCLLGSCVEAWTKRGRRQRQQVQIGIAILGREFYRSWFNRSFSFLLI